MVWVIAHNQANWAPLSLYLVIHKVCVILFFFNLFFWSCLKYCTIFLMNLERTFLGSICPKCKNLQSRLSPSSKLSNCVPTVNPFQSAPQLNFLSHLFLKMTKPYLNIFEVWAVYWYQSDHYFYFVYLPILCWDFQQFDTFVLRATAFLHCEN